MSSASASNSRSSGEFYVQPISSSARCTNSVVRAFKSRLKGGVTALVEYVVALTDA